LSDYVKGRLDMRKMLPTFSLAIMAVAAFCGTIASAQDYPNRNIRIIVPFSAGGAVDILGRLIAQKLGENWGTSVIVENRPGASGAIGAEVVARSAPDGYTLLMGYDGTLVIGPLISPNSPFDTVRDFQPVTEVASGAIIIVANPKVPAKSLQELIALDRSKPGTLTFGTSGVGSTPHLTGELLNTLTGMKLVHVPYNGGPLALRDTLSGQVQLSIIAIPTVQSYISQGLLKAIAVTTAHRSSADPTVPTVAESGLPGFDVSDWFGIMAPKGTPQPIVLKLQAEIARILQLKDIQDRLADLGVEPVGNTPDQFASQIKADIEKWKPVVARSGLRAK
jgi:tripartite-type tricarboxylate transporter receptor subunit TctC